MKLAFALLYCIQWLPLRLIHALARAVGWLAFYAVRPRRRVGLINLRHCYPEWTEQKRRALLKQHAQAVYQQASVLKLMPLNNATQITDDERALIKRWYEAGASVAP